MANPGIRSDSLYVSNLSYNSTAASLKAAFPQSIHADVVMDRNTGKSKGYGFVRFADAPAAEDVLNSVGGPGGTRNIDGRDVKINYAHNKAGGDQSRGGGAAGGGRGRGGGQPYNQGQRYNQGYNNYQGGQGGYGSGGYDQQYQQQGYNATQQGSYGQQQPYSQGGYAAYGNQGYAQATDSSAQNWQGAQQQSWQQQPNWQQGQATGQYAGGDYQQQSGGAGSFPSQQNANWGSYQ